MKKGLLIVFTGNGKGKTTAALGLALRAFGHNFRVCIIQFVKGKWKTGEMMAAGRFEGIMDFFVKGRGFLFNSKDIVRDREAAKEAWKFAKGVMTSLQYRMVILDELSYLIKYKMIEEDEVVDFLSKKRADLHVIVTGRDAPDSLIDLADLVTEMREIKHPFKSGIKAQKGIEF